MKKLLIIFALLLTGCEGTVPPPPQVETSPIKRAWCEAQAGRCTSIKLVQHGVTPVDMNAWKWQSQSGYFLVFYSNNANAINYYNYESIFLTDAAWWYAKPISFYGDQASILPGVECHIRTDADGYIAEGAIDTSDPGGELLISVVCE